MLSTRLTGSSTSMTVVSSRSARSTPVSAPARAKCSRDEAPGRVALRRGQRRLHERARARAVSRSKKAPRYSSTAPSSVGRPPATHRRVPVVAGEHLVGALTGLHDLHVLRHLLGEQVEGDAVVADHRLAHGADRRRRARRQHRSVADPDLVVVGAETLGDDVRVPELVALRRPPTRSRCEKVYSPC